MLCTAQDKDAVRLTLEQIDVIHRVCTENPELELVTTAEGTINLNLTKKYFHFAVTEHSEVFKFILNSLDNLSNIL